MIESDDDDIVIVKPCEGEWFAVPVDRASLCRWVVHLWTDYPEEKVLAKLATIPDQQLREIVCEHACIEYNRLRWGYDVRYVRPN